ncbi:hypothetical protein [Pantoea agglomerans]|uniref:hypothetical protein n=1 Tax=Enterobacter agglomerans TaxID=549 RepID=UPI00301BA748
MELRGFKDFVKKIVLSKVANILILVLFCVTTAMNLIMDSDIDMWVVGLNILLCFWILTYFRAKHREISFDWFYAVLPLLYAIFESIKKILHDPHVQKIVVNGSVGFLIGLSVIVINYGRHITIYLKQYDPTSGSNSSITRLPKEDAFFIVVLLIIFVCGSAFLSVFS